MRMCDIYTRCETKYSAVSEVGKGEGCIISLPLI